MVIALAANFPVIMQNIICEMPREQAGLRSHLRGVLLATRTLGKELRARTHSPAPCTAQRAHGQVTKHLKNPLGERAPLEGKL